MGVQTESNQVVNQSLQSDFPVIYAYTAGEDILPEAFEDLPGYDPEDYSVIFDRAIEETERRFTEAFGQLSGLFEGRMPRSIGIFVDFDGGAFVSGGIASLEYGSSKPEEGRYWFICSRYLLWNYLKAVEDPGHRLSFHDEETWYHEIIHLADHTNVLATDALIHEDCRESMFDMHLLHHRLEGVASLWKFMTRPEPLTGMDVVRGLFKAERSRIAPLLQASEDGRYVHVVDQVRSGDSFYDIGPMMVMDMLVRSGDPAAASAAGQVLTTIGEGNAVPVQLRIDVLRHALSMGNADFLRCHADLAEMKG